MLAEDICADILGELEVLTPPPEVPLEAPYEPVEELKLFELVLV